jgi:hypothetical protein
LDNVLQRQRYVLHTCNEMCIGLHFGRFFEAGNVTKVTKKV